MTSQSDLMFAGDHIALVEREDGHLEIQFSDKVQGRVCGACQLCCKLLPVPTLNKGAGHRCRHAKVGKGCMIYTRRPLDCVTWSCRWLADPKGTHAIPRPDRAHYVIDTVPDYVTMQPHDGSPAMQVDVVQVWVDPAFRDAWRTPEMRAFMLDQARKGRATIIRWSSHEAITVFAPPFDSAGEWHEMGGEVVSRTDEEANILRLDDFKTD